MYENIPSGATLIYEADGAAKEYNLPLKEYSFVSGSPLTLGFPMPEDGVITAVRLNYLQTADGSDNQPAAFTAGYTDGNNVATAVTLNNKRTAVTLDVPDQAAAKDSFQQIVIELTEGNAPVLAGTSKLMNEHWDDLIPVSLDGRSGYGGYYTEVQNSQRPVTHPDSPETHPDFRRFYFHDFYQNFVYFHQNYHFHLLDSGGAHQEGAFHSDAGAGDAAHGEVGVVAFVAHPNHGALELLHPLPVALPNAYVHADGIPGTQLGDVGVLRRGYRLQ